MKRKGIILAGGSGTRLFPATISVSKQLMPIYDKPMIYYPLSTLMSVGIREVLIITRSEDQDNFKRLFGDGGRIGMNIEYAIQEQPKGLAQAFTIAKTYLNGSPSCLILGDNLFYGGDLNSALNKANNSIQSTVFSYKVQNPNAYGVLKFNENEDTVIDLIEKPTEFVSSYAMPGIYFLDNRASDFAEQLVPSKRGELEMVDLLNNYIKESTLNVVKLDRTVAWLDTGTASNMMDASEYVRVMEKRQGVKIGCIEEIAFIKRWISLDQLEQNIKMHGKSEYADYLEQIKKAP